jgi:hypothetical protein
VSPPLPEDVIDTVLDEFERKPYPRVPTQNPNRAKVPPRGATVLAIEEIDGADSVADLKLTKGYMSAAEYRVFAQCERRWR